MCEKYEQNAIIPLLNYKEIDKNIDLFMVYSIYPLKEMSFENINTWAPNNADTVLNKLGFDQYTFSKGISQKNFKYTAALDMDMAIIEERLDAYGK